MKTQEFILQRYDADEDKVFDWADLEAHMVEDPETKEKTQEHLYAKTIFLSVGDSIENYVEVDAPTVEEETPVGTTGI